MKPEEQFKLMAAAIYEIRVLLSSYLGSQNEGDPDVRLAAHLAHGLHNEALNVIEGEPDFDMGSVVESIKKAEEIVGYEFADDFGILKRK